MRWAQNEHVDLPPETALLIVKTSGESMDMRMRLQNSDVIAHVRKAEKSIKAKEEAKSIVFNYIEVYYNRHRIHSAIGCLTPEQIELKVA